MQTQNGVRTKWSYFSHFNAAKMVKEETIDLRDGGSTVGMKKGRER